MGDHVHPNAKYVFTTGERVHDWILRQQIPDADDGRSYNTKRRWRVECTLCGTRVTLPQYYMTRKNPKKNCGCSRRGLPTQFPLEYSSWYMMNVRCYDPKHRHFKRYGGRGISVCAEWRNGQPDGFKNFVEYMHRVCGKRQPHLSLDRIRNGGNYEPGNVRWATAVEQRANQG